MSAANYEKYRQECLKYKKQIIALDKQANKLIRDQKWDELMELYESVTHPWYLVMELGEVQYTGNNSARMLLDNIAHMDECWNYHKALDKKCWNKLLYVATGYNPEED